MTHRAFNSFEELFLIQLIHDEWEADDGVIAIQEFFELLHEVRRDPALLDGEVPQVGKELVDCGEHGLHLLNMLNLNTFLIYHHVFVRFTGKDNGFNMGISNNLVPDVFIAKICELQVGDSHFNLALVCIQSTKVVATWKESVEETEISIEDRHDEADVDYGVCIFTPAICLCQVVELKDELRSIFEEEF